MAHARPAQSHYRGGDYAVCSNSWKQVSCDGGHAYDESDDHTGGAVGDDAH